MSTQGQQRQAQGQGGQAGVEVDFQEPAKVQNAKTAPQGKVDYHAVVDISKDEGLREFFARQAEANGFWEQASAIRGQAYDNSLMAGFNRTLEHGIRVKDVVTVILVGAALFLIYEGVAYKFDLPRVGVFDPSDPIKAIKK